MKRPPPIDGATALTVLVTRHASFAETAKIGRTRPQAVYAAAYRWALRELARRGGALGDCLDCLRPTGERLLCRACRARLERNGWCRKCRRVLRRVRGIGIVCPACKGVWE